MTTREVLQQEKVNPDIKVKDMTADQLYRVIRLAALRVFNKESL